MQPPALDICKTDDAVMTLFGLKNLRDYEHEIQYHEESYFGSQVNSLRRKSEKENKNEKINFTWTYKDMPSLDTNLVVHHLTIDPKIKLVKKKLHKMHPKVALLVKAEL